MALHEFRAVRAYLRAVPLLIEAGVACMPPLLFGGPKLATHRRYPGGPKYAATLLMLAAGFHQQDTARWVAAFLLALTFF